MSCKRHALFAHCLLILVMALFSIVCAAESAGTIQFTIGEVNIIDASGTSRAAQKGAAIAVGDTIITMENSAIHLKMIDGGVMAMRPDSRLKIDQYFFEGKTDGQERALISLISGSFRAITGLIGRINKENYRINTPTGYIGIRGTDHEPTYIPPAVPGARAQIAPPGTYCKVNTGIAFIQTSQGVVNIAANQVGYASGNQAPVLLPKVPEFFRATPPPRPATGSGRAATASGATGQTGQNTTSQTSSTGATSTSSSGTSSTSATSDAPAITSTSGSGTSSTSATSDAPATTSTATTTNSTTETAPVAGTSAGDGTRSTQTTTTATTTGTTATTPTSTTSSADGATAIVSSGTTSNTTAPSTASTTTGLSTTSTTSTTSTASVLQASLNTSISTPTTTTVTSTAPTTTTSMVTQPITATSITSTSLSLTSPATLTTTTTSTTPAMIPGAQVLTGYQYLMSSTTSGGGSSTTNPPPLFDWRIDAFTAASAALISKDSYGNLSTVTNGGVFNEELRSLVISGGTPYPLTPVAGPNGTYLGWLGPNASGMSVFGDDNAGCFGNTACAIPARSIGPAGLAWIMGPLASPFYLSSVTSGSGINGYTSYTLGASTAPRDNFGYTGTLNSASLGIDFIRQAVNFSMQATSAAGGIWNAQAQSIKLDSDGFTAYTGGSANTHDQLVVSLNGNTASLYGGIKGALMGSGLNAAGVTYFFVDNSTSVANLLGGALAFSGSTQSISDSYRLGALALGMLPTTGFLDEQNYYITGAFTAEARTQFNNSVQNPQPVTFEGSFNVTSVNCPQCTPQSVPAIFAVSGAANLPSIGSATLAESGYDALTGIRWGRYSAGTLGVNDRITGTSLGTIDLTNQSLHYILSGTQNSPTALPVTGTYVYSKIGGTSPTDNLGNVGTLNAASLAANFSTQTVNVSLDATVAGNTWSAAAVDVPIKSGLFEATKSTTKSTLSVTSSMGSATGGKLVGAFGGVNGNGAAILYSLNQGGNISSNASAVTVSGTAIFRR